MSALFDRELRKRYKFTIRIFGNVTSGICIVAETFFVATALQSRLERLTRVGLTARKVCKRGENRPAQKLVPIISATSVKPRRKAIDVDLKDRKRPTLKTLSEVTGFAVTTVSRALRNESEININTRLRIQKAAEDLGYRPDRAAQRLRTGRTLAIGLIFDQNQPVAEFERRMISGIAGVIYGETPHNLVVYPQKRDASDIEAVRYLVDNAQVDGLIFTNTKPQDERVRYLLDRNMPFVTHGRTEFQVPHPYHDFDTRAFAEQAVQRLVAKGRRSLRLISYASALTCSAHLLNGFTEAARDAGVTFDVMPDLFQHSDPAAFRKAAHEIAREANRPDGIVCGGELGAVAMMTGLQESGLEIGGDIDIIARSTTDLLDTVEPAIDSFHEDLGEAGETLARYLLRQFDDEQVANLQSVGAPVPRFRTELKRMAIPATATL